MIVAIDKPCSATDIKSALQGSDDAQKTKMLKKAIAMSLSGEQIPGLFITVIRDVLLSKDKTVQRLLLFYLVRPQPRAATHRFAPTAVCLICVRLTGDHREDRRIREASARDGMLLLFTSIDWVL